MAAHAYKNFQCPTCYSVFTTPNEMSLHQCINQHSKNANIQAYDENSTGSIVQTNNQDYIRPGGQVYNQSASGLRDQDYIGPYEGNHSNGTWSAPDEPSIARVTPVVTGPSSSSGGTYVIMNQDQFQI